MSKNCEEECDLKELKFLLLNMLKDREEIQMLIEKHFNSMISVYESTKKLYEDTVKIQQELIQQYGTDIISKVQTSTKASEIIITGIPESVDEEPLVIAEKVLETIGIENPKLGIITSRKVVKKYNTSNSASDSMPKSQSSCKNHRSTKSIIVTLSSSVLTKKVIRQKCSHQNLKSSTVFSSALNSSEININELYPASFYKLFLDTRSALRSMGQAMPKIKNNVITIKSDDNHPPILIKSREDLDKFIKSTS